MSYDKNLPKASKEDMLAAHALHLNAMYGQIDEDMAETPKPVETVEASTPKRRTIKVGAIKYEVPKYDYVESLEKRIKGLEQQLIDSTKKVKRLETLLNKAIVDIFKNNSLISNMKKDLDNKIDMRE